MSRNVIANARLSWVRLHLDMEGEAWQGFTAEREASRLYTPSEWPGMRKAVADLCDWGDCRPGTVRPFYGQLHLHLRNEHGHEQTIVKEIVA